MKKMLAIIALLILAIGVSDAQAGYWRLGRYYYYPNEVRPAAPVAANKTAPAAIPQRAATVQGQGVRRSYSYAPSYAPWPYYPNIGNPTGAAYSAAAGLRPGQVYGTFGLRPAGARVRGNY